jgi:acetoin utilization protein AcuB
VLVLVRDYMSSPAIGVARDTEFHAAFDLMRHRKVHHLPVVEAGRVVGIVAERDLLLAAANFGPAEVPVEEIMRAPVVCVSDRSTLRSAARVLVAKHIGSLPVVNARKELVGIITETDVFKVMAGMAHPRRAKKKEKNVRRRR